MKRPAPKTRSRPFHVLEEKFEIDDEVQKDQGMDHYKPHALPVQFFHVFILHNDHPPRLLFEIILKILDNGNHFVFHLLFSLRYT